MHQPMHSFPPAARHRLRRRQGGFLLLEIMLAVGIFTIGVLALGRCLSDCLDAQSLCAQEERARLALENRMVEIQASPALPDQTRKQTLKGMFTGITLIERRRPLDIKTETNANMTNLHEVSLSAEWNGPDGQRRASTVAFTLLRGG